METSSGRPFAVVTGGSSGIGLELARQFGQNGFDLLIAAEDADGLAEAARDLASTGADVRTATADLRSYDGVESLYADVLAAGRPVEALVLNAGVGVSGAFHELELQAMLDLVQLNVASQVHLARRVIPEMVARRRGRVLVTASIAAQAPGPFMAVYNASKAFDLSFAEALRAELKEHGVTVTALMPGGTETEFFHRAGLDDTRMGQGKKADPAEVARQGFEALMAGEDHVVGGSFGTKLTSAIAEVIPESVKADRQVESNRPGSAEE